MYARQALYRLTELHLHPLFITLRIRLSNRGVGGRLSGQGKAESVLILLSNSVFFPLLDFWDMPGTEFSE